MGSVGAAAATATPPRRSAGQGHRLILEAIIWGLVFGRATGTPRGSNGEQHRCEPPRLERNHAWAAYGDEWTELADYCGQPYGVWKDSVVQTWLVPFITPDSTVLEIALGHGRWTEAICRLAGPVILVDVSQSCIQHCQRKFSRRPKVTYIVNDGQDLSGVADNSVDFAFSFDAFVHMDVGTITAYLAELSRVLVGGGRAVIHHPGRAHVMLPLRWMRVRGGRLGRLYARLSLRRRSGRDGWRSDVSHRLLARIAQAWGLRVLKLPRFGGQVGARLQRIRLGASSRSWRG